MGLKNPHSMFSANAPRITAVAGPLGPARSLVRRTELHRVEQSGLGLLLLMLVIGVLFIRPNELIPALGELPIYEFSILAAVAAALPRLQWQMRVERFKQQPMTVCVLGVLAGIVMSMAMQAYLSGMYYAAEDFLRVIVLYFLLISVVDTPVRFQRLVRWIAIVGSITIALSVFDYLGVINIEAIQHLDMVDGFDNMNLRKTIMRMRGTGIFHDPNDISMLIVFVGILCSSFLLNRELGAVRLLWLIPLAVNVVGLLLTHSRGGLLSAAAATFTLLVSRYGKRMLIGGGLIGLVGLQVVSGRQAEIDLGDGTAYERILMWREGLTAIMSPDLLFGIGYSSYSDLAGLVAHNSFVHAYVELGLFGGTMFFGCFFFPALALYRVWRNESVINDPGLDRLRPFMLAVLAGYSTSMLSLSRCYVPTTYLVVGTLAAFIQLLTICQPTPQLFVRWDKAHRRLLCLASVFVFVGLYVFVRVMA